MKKIFTLSLFVLLWFNIAAQTIDYYSNHINTIITIDGSEYVLQTYDVLGKKHNCGLGIKNTTFKGKDNIREKTTGQIPGHIQRPFLYIPSNKAKAILKQVFLEDDCKRLSESNNELILTLYIDNNGKVGNVDFDYWYSDNDKAYLSIPPEKLGTIKHLFIDTLSPIDLYDNSAEYRRQYNKEFISKYDFDFLPTELIIRFNCDIEVLNDCDYWDMLITGHKKL